VYGRKSGGVLLLGEFGVVITPNTVIDEVIKASNSEPAFLGTFDQLEH
jgi:hypothetical protein